MSIQSALTNGTPASLPEQLEQAHELLDSAIREGSQLDIARYGRQILDIRRNLGHDVSQEDAKIQREALDKLVNVMNTDGKPRRGTLIIDNNGAFAQQWKQRAVEISMELFEGGTNADALRITTATRLVTENPLFAEAVLEQAERDASAALSADTGRQR